MNDPRPSTVHIHEFDGLRGVLALWVAVTHIVCWCGFATLSDHWPRLIQCLWNQIIFAHPAVEAFIILSGFAISYLIHSRRQSYLSFMTGRFFRIYPVYVVCLVLGFLTITVLPGVLKTASWQDTIFFIWQQPHSENELSHPFTHLLAHLTLLFGVIPKEILPEATATLLTPAWSISLEWQYYLCAPFIAVMIFSRMGVFCLTVVALLGVTYVGYWLNPQCAFLPSQLPLFLVGIGSFHLYNYLVKTGWSMTSRGVAIVVMVILLATWHRFALLIWSFIFTGLFVQGTDVPSKSISVLRRCLMHPMAQQLGKMSYPLYLVHWPLIIFFLAGLLRLQPGLTQGKAVTIMLVAGLPTILAAAWVLHKWVETPMMRLGKKVVSRS